MFAPTRRIPCRTLVRPLPLFAVVLALLVAPGASAGGRRTETWKWGGDLRPGATLRISGLHGDIVVKPTLSQALRVGARKSGRLTDPRAVEVRITREGNDVRICTVLPDREGACEPGASLAMGVAGDAEVDYVVELPAGTHLDARTVFGDLDVRGVSGEVALRTDHGRCRVETARGGSVRTLNGDIELHLARLMPGAALEASSTNGTITLAVPEDLDGTIEASSANGRVEARDPSRRREGVLRAATWTVGDPRGAVRCTSENGDVVLLAPVKAAR